jgi:hypothetical protein
MQNHSAAWPFTQPVNRDEVPDYYEVILEPMDLSTMEEKHEKDMYPTPQDFIKDATLIFGNCRRYNNETTPYAKSANKLEKFMYQQIRNIPEWSVSAKVARVHLGSMLTSDFLASRRRTLVLPDLDMCGFSSFFLSFFATAFRWDGVRRDSILAIPCG